MANEWKTHLRADPGDWLLDPDDPGARYLALRDVIGLVPEDAELDRAAREAHANGPIAAFLAAMESGGFWCEPGPGYNPKYKSSVWSLITLAQLGASSRYDQRISQACDYMCANGLTAAGQFTASGAPSGTADCLQGNMCAALLTLGVEFNRLMKAFEWMARTVTGEGLAPNTDRQAQLRYYAGKCGPVFACGSNNKLACAWGAVKVMLALGLLTETQKTDLIDRAIQTGVDFLLNVDPASAEYPNGWNDKPSGNWWKFGFPVFYVTDLLQLVESLVALGYGRDPRLEKSIELILQKQDEQGRWPLEYSYSGKTLCDFGQKKAASKWVTIRVLRVLKEVHD